MNNRNIRYYVIVMTLFHQHFRETSFIVGIVINNTQIKPKRECNPYYDGNVRIARYNRISFNFLKAGKPRNIRNDNNNNNTVIKLKLYLSSS